MKRKVLFLLLMFSAFNIWATEVPTLLILMTANDEVQVPIASIQKITYDDDGTTMFVQTTTGQQSYPVTDVKKMTLSNVPEPTALDNISFPSGADQGEAIKFIMDGVVYIVRDGKLFTVDGGQVQ